MATNKESYPRTKTLSGLIAFYYKVRLLAKYLKFVDVAEVDDGVGEVSIRARLTLCGNPKSKMVHVVRRITAEDGSFSFGDIDFLHIDEEDLPERTQGY